MKTLPENSISYRPYRNQKADKQTEQRDTCRLFDETSTEKSVNWSKAFCPVCQPIVDGHFRKREREMLSEIARLQTQLDKATGNMPQTSEQRDTAQPFAPNDGRMKTEAGKQAWEASQKASLNWFPIAESATDQLLKLTCEHKALQAHAERLAEALKETIEAINDELGACGDDEVREHPVLARHAKIAKRAEKTLAAWEGAQK